MNSEPRIWKIDAPPAPVDAIAVYERFAARPKPQPRRRLGKAPGLKLRKKLLRRLLKVRGVKSVAALATDR